MAINGHGSSGKTSLSRQLSAVLPDCSVLHTDDLAWHHGVFAWDELLIKNVLPALRDGQPQSSRGAWDDTQRSARSGSPRYDRGAEVVEGVSSRPGG